VRDPALTVEAKISGLSVVTPPPEPNRSSGQMTSSDFSSLNTLALADVNKLAAQTGQTADATAYNATYDAVYRQYSTGVPADSQWMWEGNGYAGAWDGTKSPPIDPRSYNHYETQVVYDAAGLGHVMTTYYQKNPHSPNVWDYIVTCDPQEDGRLDSAGRPVAGTALAGLLQKGKITFDTNGKIKDLEAQDLNPAASQAAWVDRPGPGAGSLANIRSGGNFTGPGQINPATGALVSAPRTYTITLSANTGMTPPTHGFVWNDGLNSGFTAMDVKYVLPSLPGYPAPYNPDEVDWALVMSAAQAAGQTLTDYLASAYVAVITYPGPYALGNDGLTLTFNLDPANPLPLFGAPGQSTQVTAHSEQLGWAAGAPNARGYLAVGVQFADAPAQSIDLDMGARRTGGILLLTEPSTTQYGGRSLTVDARQDGYPEGAFSHLYVTPDGYVTCVYSNKQEIAQYQLCITRFINPWGLLKMGNNLFAATRQSGQGVDLTPGEDGAAVILGGFLEQSNVDTATEIVTMIMTQRGFQANSKVVTTHDDMIATAIQTKR
jgi:flagellar hook protein FlgE